MKRKILLTFLALLLVAQLAAQGRKVALVIGNSAYSSIQTLMNPANDATDVSAVLQRIGFTVLSKLDCDRKSMRGIMDDFNKAIQGADVALFYYSGHGVQLNGENYLVPTNAEVVVAGDVAEECVQLSRVTNRMIDAGAGTNVIILDACRDNPFKAVTRGIDRGLVVVGQKPPESIIVYATAENEKAEDGTGRNGTFTAAFLDNIEKPISFTDVLYAIKDQVRRATGSKQKPAVYDNLSRPVYLAGSKDERAPATSSRLESQTPEQKSTDAIASLRKAAERGDAEAQIKLGAAYFKGDGVPKDYAVAMMWYHKAANQGSQKAQAGLGVLYSEGDGVTQDYAEAARWYRKAADQGHVVAQLLLGSMYETGEGVEQDYVQAYKWFNLAASSPTPEPDARKYRDNISKLMTSAQIAEAQRLAREWKLTPSVVPAETREPDPSPAGVRILGSESGQVIETIVSGSEKGNSLETVLGARVGKAGRILYVPIYLYMPLPRSIDSSVVGRVPPSRRENFFNYYSKKGNSWALSRDVSLDERDNLWMALEEGGYDFSKADYLVGRQLKPVELSFVVTQAAGRLQPRLEAVTITSSSGDRQVDEAVVYGFKRAAFFNATDETISGTFSYRFNK